MSQKCPEVNWRDEQEYNYCESLDGEGWAWEFLRRNLEYRSEYDEAYRQSLTGDGVRYTPPREPEETPQIWRRRAILATGNLPLVDSPLTRLAERWHVDVARDYRFDPPPMFVSQRPIVVSKAQRFEELCIPRPQFEDQLVEAGYPGDLQDKEHVLSFIQEFGLNLSEAEMMLPDGLFGIVFDLNQDLAGQLSRARSTLVDAREKRLLEVNNSEGSSSRIQIQKFSRHLRMLDAMDDDATKREVVEALFPVQLSIDPNTGQLDAVSKSNINSKYYELKTEALRASSNYLAFLKRLEDIDAPS